MMHDCLAAFLAVLIVCFSFERELRFIQMKIYKKQISPNVLRYNATLCILRCTQNSWFKTWMRNLRWAEKRRNKLSLIKVESFPWLVIISQSCLVAQYLIESRHHLTSSQKRKVLWAIDMWLVETVHVWRDSRARLASSDDSHLDRRLYNVRKKSQLTNKQQRFEGKYENCMNERIHSDDESITQQSQIDTEEKKTRFSFLK